jgi:hypothetical protein
MKLNKVLSFSKLRKAITNPDASTMIKKLRFLISRVAIPVYYLDHISSVQKTKFGWEGPKKNSVKIFCLIHHSNLGILDDFDQSTLNQMKKLGFYTLLFTNSQSLDSKYADEIHVKARFGRDFAVLRDFARGIVEKKFDHVELLFMNNSMVWENVSLSSLIDQLKALPEGNLIFPTSSKYPKYHLQPYFMYSVLNDDQIIKFSMSFEWIRNWRLRRTIIHFGEYKIYETLKSLNWNIKVIAEYEAILNYENLMRSQNHEVLLRSNSSYYNPTLQMWRSLPYFGLVGVKRSLIANNSYDLKNSPTTLQSAMKMLTDKEVR